MEPIDKAWMLSVGFEADPDDDLYVRFLMHQTKPMMPADINRTYLVVYVGPNCEYDGLICLLEKYGSGKCEYFTEMKYGVAKTRDDVLLLLKALKLN